MGCRPGQDGGPAVGSFQGVPFLRGGMAAAAPSAAMAAWQARVSQDPPAVTMQMRWSSAIRSGRSGSTGASPTRLPVIAMALVRGVSAWLSGKQSAGLFSDPPPPRVGLAPVARLRRAVFPGQPLAVACHLHPGAVDQQVQATRAGAARDLGGQGLPAAARGAEARHRPARPGQIRQAGDHPAPPMPVAATAAPTARSSPIWGRTETMGKATSGTAVLWPGSRRAEVAVQPWTLGTLRPSGVAIPDAGRRSRRRGGGPKHAPPAGADGRAEGLRGHVRSLPDRRPAKAAARPPSPPRP